MVFSGMSRRVALVRTDVSEELNASFIRVTRIGELGTTLTVTSNRRTLRSEVPSQWIDKARRPVKSGVTSHIQGLPTLMLHLLTAPVTVLGLVTLANQCSDKNM
jgi:hypothetical protein